MRRFQSCSRLAAVLTVAAVVLCVAPRSNAALQFIGQWQVDQGPNWGNNPPVYSGQEAAALLFGGPPTKYSISTLGINPGLVDNQAWYSIWGISGGTKGAESLHLDQGNPGYNDPGGNNTAWSAYVNDNATGPTYTNYAFVTIPEPSAIVLFGIGAIGFMSRGRRRKD